MTINKDIYEIINTLTPKDNGYLFDTDGFQQSAKLAKLLKKLDIPRTDLDKILDKVSAEDIADLADILK